MNILAMILAGGEGRGLGVLTAHRAEAAVPFGGKYRLIDFSLSNCVNSGIYSVGVLTQYQPRSLNDHIGIGKPWDLDRARGGVRLLQPFQRARGQGGTWQEGTADAVRFNFDFITEHNADNVLILAGDHIYKMDYNALLRLHAETDADVTIGVRSVSPFDTHRFGMVTLDADTRVTQFEEKPKRTRSTTASMGIYAFKRSFLQQWLTGEGLTQHDFGRDVLPSLIEKARVFGFNYQGYWADVGAIQAYFEANMALLGETPALDLYDPDWIIHTRSEERPAVYVGADARVDGNLLCDGCRIDGTVTRSIIGPGVYVAHGAVVRDSILMKDTYVGERAVVDRVIADKRVVVGAGAHVGDSDDNTPNQVSPTRLNTGITVIGKRTQIPPGIHIGRNVEINANLPASIFPTEGVKSGATVMG
ncbi:MAG: glucose-1-phosphate adenylyltransferase subunit GlgD [Chloroflexi bacterium]|nr:glucose-1-phosphate adenylyltransferase subunit GlgD [Chloroflexota bacterium]